MKKRKWDMLISFLCLLVLVSAFLRFVRISLPEGSGLLKGAGLGGGVLTFSVYRLFRGLLSLEYDWSLIGKPAKELYLLIGLTALPYACSLISAILVWARGRWKYVVTAVLSALSVFELAYGMIVKLPDVLSVYADKLAGGTISWMFEKATDTQFADFLQENMTSFLMEGFWCCVVLLALICLLSLLLYVAARIRGSR